VSPCASNIEPEIPHRGGPTAKPQDRADQYAARTSTPATNRAAANRTSREKVVGVAGIAPTIKQIPRPEATSLVVVSRIVFALVKNPVREGLDGLAQLFPPGGISLFLILGGNIPNISL
jgi:hypothetical protein